MNKWSKNYKPEDSSRGGSDQKHKQDRSRDDERKSSHSRRSKRNGETHSTESNRGGQLGGPTVTFGNIEQFLSDDEEYI
jgi:hypothetical protein